MNEEVRLTSSTDLLKKLRFLLGLKNGYELANLIGVKPNTMSSWKVRDSIPYHRIVDLCKRYNIDLNELFFDNYAKNDLTQKYVQIPMLYLHHYWNYYYDLTIDNTTVLPLAHFPGEIDFDLIIQVATESENDLSSRLFFTFCKKITPEELISGKTYIIIVKNRGFLYAKLQGMNPASTILELDLGGGKITHVNNCDILELFICKGIYSEE